jgi:hypothetical protein
MELSQIIGFVAGFGKPFAALPELDRLLRRSSAGMNSRICDHGPVPNLLDLVRPGGTRRSSMFVANALLGRQGCASSTKL